jgi:hypothetical protein
VIYRAFSSYSQLVKVSIIIRSSRVLKTMRQANKGLLRVSGPSSEVRGRHAGGLGQGGFCIYARASMNLLVNKHGVLEDKGGKTGYSWVYD